MVIIFREVAVVERRPLVNVPLYMLIILNIISESNFRSKMKERKKEILGFHVMTEERIGLHMTCMYMRI